MAKLLTLLFEITALFEMTARIELVMLQKTMAVVEGVARKLDPQLNMWSTAEPVVGAWIADNHAPLALLDDVIRGLSSFAAFLGDAPRRLEEIASRLEALSRAWPSENPYENSPRSRASNTTTFLAIAISLTLMAILWYHRRQ
jgi:ubiquinone biosynthesis protein